MKKLLVYLVACGLVACGKIPSEAPGVEQSKPGMAAPMSEPVVITGEERKSIVQSLTKSMDEERDKMERISFYSAKHRAYLVSALETYISLPDDSLPILRIKSTYFGSDWVFYDSIKVMADEVVVYDHSFSHSDVRRDNSGGSVWEVGDYYAKEPDLAALKKIASAKAATIRFSGREHREDHDLTAKELQQLKEVIGTYEKLKTQLQRA